MNKRITLLLFIVLFSLLLIGLGGYTYSYLRKSSSQGTPNDITTFSCLDLSITNVSGSSPINLQNTYPISDEEGLATTPYSFTVTNNCANVTLVEVNLESLDIENNISANYIKVAVDHNGVIAPIPKVLGALPSKTATISGASSNNIDTVYLDEGESRTYSLQIWINEETTKEQAFNMTYEGKVVAVANPTHIYIPNINFKNLPVNTLLYHVASDTRNVYSAPLTTPGKQVSLSTEAVMPSSLDDYGTSFYYRGAVENNYVVFAGMCWRIVRITGDGSIKLVLYNASSTNCATTGKQLSYITVNGSDKSRFNNVSNVNFMYGDTSSSNFLISHANINDSVILSRLKVWYKEKLIDTDLDFLLADTIWCNDVRTVSATGDYESKTRITKATANPTLICQNDFYDGKLSKFTAEDNVVGNAALHNADGTLKYKVGLLTADEVLFAGAVQNETLPNYYLKNNTVLGSGSIEWYTMTPAGGATLAMWCVGTTIRATYSTTSLAARPAISLNKNILLYSGTGTSIDPYIVQEGLYQEEVDY